MAKNFRIDLPEPEFRIIIQALDCYVRRLDCIGYSKRYAIDYERACSLSKALEENFFRKKRMRSFEECFRDLKNSVLV